jgi:acetyltransferase-like isoleucine patch superfamily enzyme
MKRIIQKILFRIRAGASTKILSPLRKLFLSIQGLDIGDTTLPSSYFSWPHKVKIGNKCQLESHICFKHDGVWSEGKSIIIGDRVFIGRNTEFNIRKLVSVGDDCLIASNCKFIDHDHGFADIEMPMNLQPGPEEEIILENNVWLGANVVVLKGVVIGCGAIVAAGAVVNKSIPSCEVWGGVPARKIGVRKSEDKS